MKILDNTKSLSVLASDTTNGLGQIQPITALVTEELNGVFEAEITLSTKEPHFNKISVGSILKLPVNDTDDEQMFRVYFISKPINEVCTIRLQHITYDLSKVPVKPFEAVGAVLTKNGMINNIIGSYPFTMSTDITNNTSKFTLDIPRSFRECLGGYEGSILDVFRCEYKWDNLNVAMLGRRGHDNGVRIAYGKNLTDFNQEENIESVYDAVLGYAVVDDITYIANNIYNKTGATTPRVKIVDFSEDYESGDTPTQAELLTKATTYATNNDIEVPKVNITISFVPLYQTEEYKNILPLERVSLGDTVHVYFDKLNVEASSRVIRTVWDCLLNKYEEIELGDAKANLNSVISDTASDVVGNAIDNLDIDVDVSWLDEKVVNMTTLIANGMGLKMTQDSAGRIFLHNEPTLAQSQYQYMITAQGFMLSEDYGQTWSSGWTASGDAVFNAIWTQTLRAGQIITGVLQDQLGYNYWDLDTGEFSLSANTLIGGKTADEIADDSVDAFKNGDYATFVTNTNNALNTKITTYYQTSAPTGAIAGDLWIDTDDGNKLYRWNGSQWVDVQDDAIQTALTNAATAQTTADGKIVTFAQTGQPTATDVGDLWIDTDDDNKLYRWNGTSWVQLTDTSAVNTLDNSLNQLEIFNRLTNNGATQGIYLNNGLLYINADYIRSGTINAINIAGSVITFGDTTNKYITAQTYSLSNVQQGVSFDGTGTIRLQPQTEFLVNVFYNGSSSNKIGVFDMAYSLGYDTSQNQYFNSRITLTNYDASSNRAVQGLSMRSDQYAGFSTYTTLSLSNTYLSGNNYGQLQLTNYKLVGSTTYPQQSILLDSRSTEEDKLWLLMYKPNTNTEQMSIRMSNLGELTNGGYGPAMSMGVGFKNTNTGYAAQVQLETDVNNGDNGKIYLRAGGSNPASIQLIAQSGYVYIQGTRLYFNGTQIA